MPRAGFYTVESGRISFRKDGNWYTDEERIDNQRIAALFSKSIRQSPDGSFYLQVAEERAPIEVEDTPYVVKAVENAPGGGFAIVLNDDEREALDPASLEVGPANVLYTAVKGGRFRARFLRTAYYHLSGNFEADDRGGFFIRIADRCFPIAASATHRPN